MEEKYKVIFIGLDGATWDILKKNIKNGRLKTFKTLTEKGVIGKLKSTIPPISPSAWTSIFTGVNPGKHGIYGFVREDKSSHFLVPISSKDRKCDPIWRIVSKHGKRVIALNIPFSYPPDKVNGIMSSGLGTPSINSNFVYPESYREFIIKKFPDFDIDFDEETLADNLSKLLNKIRKVTIAEIDLCKYLLENEEWDLFIFVFRALDVVQHFFWDKPEVLAEFYELFDSLLRYIVDNIVDKNENVLLFISSDHGFNELHTLVYVNNWLESLGLFKYKRKSKKRKITRVINAEKIQKIMLKLRLKRLVWILKRKKFLKFLLKIIPSESVEYIYNIDWTQTKAYFSEASYGIHINTSSVIDKEEYERIRKYIIKESDRLVNPNNNEKIVKKVYRKEDLYRGKYAKEGPDIVLLKREGYRFVGGYNTEGNIFVKSLRETGDHNEGNGILIAYGKELKKGYVLKNVNVYDIFPTILRVLQLPIPSYVDGRVLKEIFHESSILFKKEIQYEERSYEDEKEKIREVVRNLKIKHKL